jgi:hypothetical protein
MAEGRGFPSLSGLQALPSDVEPAQAPLSARCRTAYASTSDTLLTL